MRDDEPRPVWMSLLITNHALVNAGVGRLCERMFKEGGGSEGECERKRALGVLLCHSLGH